MPTDKLGKLVNKEITNRYGKRIKVGKYVGGAALGLAATYGAHKLLKRNKKKDNN